MIKLRNLPTCRLVVVLAGSAFLAHCRRNRLRRSRPRSPPSRVPPPPKDVPDADGFMQRWLILEPIRANGTHRQRRPGGRQK